MIMHFGHFYCSLFYCHLLCTFCVIVRQKSILYRGQTNSAVNFEEESVLSEGKLNSVINPQEIKQLKPNPM